MTKPQLWPIFICYRRVDGGTAARRLHEMLDKWQTGGPDGQTIQIDAYLDETMPGIADWKAMHRPYLERSRAIVVVCTPGARIDEGPDDWVHLEINWWLEHRETAPILVDPLKEGLRYVPLQIAQRWPDIQRIPLVEEEWSRLSGAPLQEKTDAVRRLIIGAILPSGAAIYAKELEQERERAEQLRRALAIAQASLLDTRAASLFNESRLIGARREREMDTRADILGRLASPTTSGARERNLRHELGQLDAEAARLRAAGREALRGGREYLQQADRAWEALQAAGTSDVQRQRPEPPDVFSVELLNAGRGESILLHYGTPDDIKVLVINAGPRKDYAASVEPRLRQLGAARFDGGPVPIELFIVSDRDEEKTGGLERLLSGLAEPAPPQGHVADVRGIWANIFRVDDGRAGLRARIRALIDDLGIPLNQPFDHHVMRPEKGRAVVTMPGGLEIVVLGPTSARIASLYQASRNEAMKAGTTLESLLPETFGRVAVETNPEPLRAQTATPADPGTDCIPSENASRFAGGTYADNAVSNLASTIVLFRFGGRTFLYTGDSRGDLILDGLGCAGLLDEQGEASVDLMTIPHLGSRRNVTVDFFRRVKAAGYLFSGDGTIFGLPDIETVAALVTARSCDSYSMYFVNRDSPHSPPPEPIHRGRATRPGRSAAVDHGRKLDTFFQQEERFHPNYRRLFRSSSSGSVIIDLLNPVRY
jgi:beta-lactamase superfamily II metal-dependent hydrolase